MIETKRTEKATVCVCIYIYYICILYMYKDICSTYDSDKQKTNERLCYQDSHNARRRISHTLRPISSSNSLIPKKCKIQIFQSIIDSDLNLYKIDLKERECVCVSE
jgi:hypothetical protein